ncbi:helix-turn-helix domain-containing protein [Actinoplanes sp. TRM 88003]|uniref:Helix-turn-helix domain-containing protein n=1 Tax=Paractinoplanes aksuensis TaxID=2939490 RepID=A0ABT1DT49_9ACTN|nr:helix-turn-helix transcriptional regulator [Actinoplanes aksuensis]MCO8273688.1 helix-turn-helix domain-containing protein [Actinoplanes aksuensis]
MAEFGALLRHMRNAADLTIEQLAEVSGVSDRSISDMERGVSRRPRPRTVEALADGLRLSDADRSALLTAAREGRNEQAPGPANRSPLPRQVADFTGRADELATVANWAEGATDQGPAPVIAISGSAGVGKTTFAVRAARAWPVEQQLFVDLRGLDAKPLTPLTVLSRLIRAVSPDVRAVPRDVDESSALWHSLVRGRRVVVVLDNAVNEGQVRPALPPHGPAVVLVTSRRSLSGLEDVHRLRLEPLPEGDSTALLATMLPHSGATPEQLRRIADLCVHVPLALRIAGNRLASRPGWTADDLITRLAAQERRLDALSAGDLQVKAAFDLSYQQLSGVTRRLFRRLALVPGSSTGPELAAVLVQEPLPVTEDALDDLIDLSLLQQRPDGRFEFHDLLRLYAAGALDREESAADRAAAGRRREEWLLGTVIVAGRHFEPGYGPGRAGATEVLDLTSSAEAADWLRAEAENWLPALQAVAADGQDQRVVDVAEALHWFSDSWFLWPGWEDVYTLSVRATERLGDDRLRAVHEGYLAWVYIATSQQNHEAGLAHARIALDHAVRSGDRRQIGWANYYVSWALMSQERYADMVGYSRAAVAELRAVGDLEGVPNALLQLGIAQMHRDAGAAIQIFEEVSAVVRDPATAPPAHIADLADQVARSYLTEIEMTAGRWPAALVRINESIAATTILPDPRALMLKALTRRAQINIELGDFDAVRADLTEVRSLREVTGNLATRAGDLRDRIERVEQALAAHDATQSSR